MQDLQDQWLSKISNASSLEELESYRVASLGKKGEITAELKNVSNLPAEKRREAGQAVNVVKQAVVKAISEQKIVLEQQALDARLANESVDVSLPAGQAYQPTQQRGSLHPIPETINEIQAIFQSMGFGVKMGSDIEDDFHNFTALNIPPEHPARQMHDTFYIKNTDEQLLRTHTSPVQIHTMTNEKPPLRFIVPGRTYRADSDQTHTPMFHQVEGVVIEPGIHMGHLKGCLQEFLSRFFELPNVPMRLRPSFFPFTEPSAEVDIACRREKGQLIIGEGDDWLEVLGCGMIHPNVLKSCNLDPKQHQGFAFGMGVERLAMLKRGIPDLRAFFATNMNWLRHFDS